MVEHATESTKVREDTKAALAIGFLILYMLDILNFIP